MEARGDEKPMSCAEAARWVTKIRPGGRRCAPNTIWRWHAKGIAGARLEGTCIGARLCVTRAGLLKFFAAVPGALAARSDARTRMKRGFAAVGRGSRMESRRVLIEAGILRG